MIAAADETCGGVVVNQTSVTCPEVMACIAALPTGAPAIAGDLVLGSDNEFHALPAGHATVLAACPATGPTVAPTSEGHYYYTSTLGEKWVWVYGDSAPFVIGKRYGDINAAAAGVLPLLGVNPITLPRAGYITITAWQTGDNTTIPANSAVRTGIVLNGVEINASRDNGQDVVGAVRHGQSCATRVLVAQGNIISANYSAAGGSGTVTASHLRYQYNE